jgi:hypothetical protein
VKLKVIGSRPTNRVEITIRALKVALENIAELSNEEWQVVNIRPFFLFPHHSRSQKIRTQEPNYKVFHFFSDFRCKFFHIGNIYIE